MPGARAELERGCFAPRPGVHRKPVDGPAVGERGDSTFQEISSTGPRTASGVIRAGSSPKQETNRAAKRRFVRREVPGVWACRAAFARRLARASPVAFGERLARNHGPGAHARASSRRSALRSVAPAGRGGIPSQKASALVRGRTPGRASIFTFAQMDSASHGIRGARVQTNPGICSDTSRGTVGASAAALSAPPECGPGNGCVQPRCAARPPARALSQSALRVDAAGALTASFGSDEIRRADFPSLRSADQSGRRVGLDLRRVTGRGGAPAGRPAGARPAAGAAGAGAAPRHGESPQSRRATGNATRRNTTE